MCGESGADASLCLDACGGYHGARPLVDAFVYRYHVIGPWGGPAPSSPSDGIGGDSSDSGSSGKSGSEGVPLSAMLEFNGAGDGSFYPYTPLCLAGCRPRQATPQARGSAVPQGTAPTAKFFGAGNDLLNECSALATPGVLSTDPIDPTTATTASAASTASTHSAPRGLLGPGSLGPFAPAPRPPGLVAPMPWRATVDSGGLHMNLPRGALAQAQARALGSGLASIIAPMSPKIGLPGVGLSVTLGGRIVSADCVFP